MMTTLLWLASLGVLAAAWLGPLPRMARHSFAAHMSLHMAVVAVAAPLLALAIASLRSNPVRRWPRLFPAIVASVFELVIVWLWHAPVLHHFARHSAAGFVLEQSTFLISGLWLWMSALGTAGSLNENTAIVSMNERRGAGVLALLLTSMHMTLLGALLLLSPRILFMAHAHGAGTEHSLWDQQLGGCIMLVGGGVAYLVGGVSLLAKMLPTRSSEATSL